MAKQIEVLDSQVSPLVEWIDNQIFELDFQIKELIEKKNGFIKMKSSLVGINEFAQDELSGYDTNWGLLQKIEYALESVGYPLTSKEISNTLERIEPNINANATTELATRIAGSISKMAQERRRFGRYEDGKSIKYGIQQWFDEHGNLKRDKAPQK